MDHAAERVNHGGNAGIGGAHQRQAFLDHPQPRLPEMLVGAGTDAEPAVVGEIEHPAGPVVARHRLAREDHLITDQRQHARRPRHVVAAAAIAREITAGYLGQLLQADALEQSLQRQIFAERHQMHLVVHDEDRAVMVDT